MLLDVVFEHMVKFIVDQGLYENVDICFFGWVWDKFFLGKIRFYHLSFVFFPYCKSNLAP